MVSLYIHIPFCHSRCSYCDFATWAGRENLMEPYGASIRHEVALLSPWLQRDGVDTVYVGGGTPSLFPIETLTAILRSVPLDKQAEITIEANPGTVDADSLSKMREAGINRLSLGMQSARSEELQLLGRTHKPDAVHRAVEWARAAGFERVSLDLIFGLPGQIVAEWNCTVQEALELHPEHLSLYALTVEPGTRLATQINNGQAPMPDPDEAAAMYEWAEERLRAAGYGHYEISNWARPGFEAQHNLAYWRNKAYIGVGASAWGHWPLPNGTGWRLRNERDPQGYILRLRNSEQTAVDLPVSPACIEQQFIPTPWAMAETMFMGLRLVTEGVSRAAFEIRFGVDPVRHYDAEIRELQDLDHIEVDDNSIRLNHKSVLVSNKVLTAFLPQ